MSAAAGHRPPFVDADHEVAQLYLDASRLLPIGDVPDLAECLSHGGLAIGLCDPVANILLTTFYALAIHKKAYPRPILEANSKEEALKQANDKRTFLNAAYRSRQGLITFMRCYFRHLTSAEAEVILADAGHSLPLAVSLVEKSCGSSLGLPDPDSATTKIAMEMASRRAGYYDPENHFLCLMASRYDPSVRATIRQVLCGGAQLTALQVGEICDLLGQPCQLPPPPTIRTFRNSNAQVITNIELHDHLVRPLAVSPRGVVSRAIITSPSPAVSLSTAPSPAVPLSTASSPTVPLSTALTLSSQGQMTTWFLRMSLLDAMHELYLKALTQLPTHSLHRRHLIRAVLTAGHTYDPMAHPVANIMFNTIWYDTLFPFCQTDPPAADILDTRCMSCVESRSLDAIVTLIHKSAGAQQREALLKLCKDRRELRPWSQDFRLLQRNIDDVLLAAKHPQPLAYAAFVRRLTLDVVGDMRGLIMMDQVISDDAVCQLKEMITKIAAPANIAAAPALSKSNLETLSAFKYVQGYVRGVLYSLLGVVSQHEGQEYHVDLICGVASQTYYNNILCYHVNFLADMDIDVQNDATPTPMPKLFFAEFWNRCDERIEESTKPPICCVVQDYPRHFGRCNVCESTSSTLVHPPYCEYFMAISDGGPFPFAEGHRETARLREAAHHELDQGIRLGEADHELDQGMLDFGFIYSDAAKDAVVSVRIRTETELQWRHLN